MIDLRVFDTAEEASREAAQRMAAAIVASRRERGTAHIALAGGETPKRAYEMLATELEDWSGVEVWFGDERAVSAGDPESNYRMVCETLLASGGPEPSAVRRIEGERGPEEAAAAYAELLRERVPIGPGGLPVLDLAFQGLGPDAHTASLFPGNPGLDATGICVAVHDSPKPPPDRITMTLGILKAARSILFLATGPSKADPVRALLAGPDPAAPASLLGGERTAVIADRAAASNAAG